MIQLVDGLAQKVSHSPPHLSCLLQALAGLGLPSHALIPAGARGVREGRVGGEQTEGVLR